jgi:hypothetical protein
MTGMLFSRSFSAAIALASLFGCAAEEEGKPAPNADHPDPIVEEVRERCSDFAARLCASATSCCESGGVVFSPERCAASFAMEFCGPAASVVGAGLADYHPEAEEPCLTAWAHAHEACVADWQEILAFRKEVWSACKMVRGKSAVGSGCSTSSQCSQPDGAAVARCLSTPPTNQLSCQVLEILGEGAECPWPDGEVSVCDTGLYCTSSGRGVPGTCERIVPEGEACDPDVALNPECGLGNYCGLDDGVCHLATNFGGPSCEQAPECVSFLCDRSSSGGECRAPISTANDLCTRGKEE